MTRAERRRIWAYGAACASLVVLVVAGLALVLEEGRLPGLVMAGGVAATLQVLALAARYRWGTTPNRLLATWIGSTGARFTAVLLTGLAVWRFDSLDVVATLVGLAGFLLVMLLMEPAFFAPGRLELNDGEIVRS